MPTKKNIFYDKTNLTNNTDCLFESHRNPTRKNVSINNKNFIYEVHLLVKSHIILIIFSNSFIRFILFIN